MAARRQRGILVAGLIVLVGLAATARAQQSAARAAAPNQPAPKRSAAGDSKLIPLLEGTDAQRADALRSLDETADPARTLRVLKRVLDRESRRQGPLRESSLELLRRVAKLKEPTTLATMVAWIKAPNYRFGIAAAEVLAERGDPEAISALMDIGREPHFADIFGFRKTVVDLVLSLNDPRAVEFAVRLLPQASGIVRYDLLRYLLTVTDQDFGNAEAHWGVWWQDNERDFRRAAKLPAYDPKQGSSLTIRGLPAPTFYGLKIYAKRIVFVVDTSSSMVADGPKPPNSRMDVAKRELTATLRDLPADTEFTVLAFNSAVGSWGKLLPATPENKAKAIQWVQQLKHGTGTNTHEGLVRAFAVGGNVEAIVLLSDGRPSVGLADPGTILANVAKENKARKLSIYTIGIFTGEAVNGALSGFMSELARQNRGAYKQVQ